MIELCGICKRQLPMKKRPKLKGSKRYVHAKCEERARQYIEDNWETLPDPRTWTK